jgi:galactokinase/mevalonate kinase-like predicted kinase
MFSKKGNIMAEALSKLRNATGLLQLKEALDVLLPEVIKNRFTENNKERLIRALILNKSLQKPHEIQEAVSHVFSILPMDVWNQHFSDAVENQIPSLLLEILEMQADVDHRQVLRLVAVNHTNALYKSIEILSKYFDDIPQAFIAIRGMRAARIMVDLYQNMEQTSNAWHKFEPPSCKIDNEFVIKLKVEKRFNELSGAYEDLINDLQRIDLQYHLASLGQEQNSAARFNEQDYSKQFTVTSPLRIGISSANASDNHLRSKEQGGKTLNIGIDLQMEGEKKPTSPLTVNARRIEDPKLILKSRSMDFNADFEIAEDEENSLARDHYFQYRHGGDEALRLVKQALVHVGIVGNNSDNIIGDIKTFTGGGGLEISTTSKIVQGSGLGTSSILAASVLKLLYRLSNHAYGSSENEYPGLYDQSILLEQSFGLNSGWQDARGACGGPSAIKDFYAPATDSLPTPERRFIKDIDEASFVDRVILFDTGIARSATRGLNEVLDAYLTRDTMRYRGIRGSLDIHDEMVAALQNGNYTQLGTLATKYWDFRCLLDPGATNEALQYLFDSPEIKTLSDGGLLTGAGGGGFALIIARNGCNSQLRELLNSLKNRPEYSKSGVVSYGLNSTGIKLTETSK